MKLIQLSTLTIFILDWVICYWSIRKFKLDFPKEDHKLFVKAMNNNFKLLKRINFHNKNELKSEQVFIVMKNGSLKPSHLI